MFRTDKPCEVVVAPPAGAVNTKPAKGISTGRLVCGGKTCSTVDTRRGELSVLDDATLTSPK